MRAKTTKAMAVTPARAAEPDDDEARAGRAAATDLAAALEEMRRHDPYYDPPMPLRVVGHGPAHPAGRAARELGHQLRVWREARGLSQRDLAERLGWEQPHVARLEAGAHTPNLATLDRLARRLGLEVTLRATPEWMTVDVRDASPDT